MDVEMIKRVPLVILVWSGKKILKYAVKKISAARPVGILLIEWHFKIFAERELNEKERVYIYLIRKNGGRFSASHHLVDTKFLTKYKMITIGACNRFVLTKEGDEFAEIIENSYQLTNDDIESVLGWKQK